MNRREIRHEEARIRSAIDWLQRRLDLNFEWVLSPNPGIEAFEMERSNRGVEDPRCFILEYNPDTVHALSMLDLKNDIYHEMLHAMTWDWWEALLAHAPRSEWIPLRRKVYEPAVYEIERRTRQYVVGNGKARG